MIEVEKKYSLQPGDRERLLDGATFIKTKTHTDTYYDSKDWKLCTRDIWLRKRNDSFEVKFPTVIDGTVATHQFHEYETEPEIIAALATVPELGFSTESAEPLETLLSKLDYTPFGSITTTREEYTKDGFILDFDSSDFGHTILEIELMVERADQADEAVEKIKAFAAAHGIPTVRTRGKVMAYIKQFHPDLYALQFPHGDGFER